MNNAIIKKVKGTSKKTGREFTAYQFSIGLFKSPLLFPTEIERQYIDAYVKKEAHEDFKGDDLDTDEEGRF